METNLTAQLIQSVGALALVLAIFAALIWGLKRLQLQRLPSNTKNMHIVQRISLDARHSLVEVERGTKRYVLGLSSTGMQLIESFEATTSEAAVSEAMNLEAQTDV